MKKLNLLFLMIVLTNALACASYRDKPVSEENDIWEMRREKFTGFGFDRVK